MGETGQLSHSGGVGGWSNVAENIGTGGSANTVFSAMKSSAGHYATMTDSSFTHVGIGVWVDGYGQLWTLHVFATP